jgi:hypothetical protein
MDDRPFSKFPLETKIGAWPPGSYFGAAKLVSTSKTSADKKIGTGWPGPDFSSPFTFSASVQGISAHSG